MPSTKRADTLVFSFLWPITIFLRSNSAKFGIVHQTFPHNRVRSQRSSLSTYYRDENLEYRLMHSLSPTELHRHQPGIEYGTEPNSAKAATKIAHSNDSPSSHACVNKPRFTIPFFTRPCFTRPSTETRFSKERRMGMLAAMGLSLSPALANAKSLTYPELRLKLYNLHTSEQVDTVFWADGDYNIEGLKLLNNLLRDHRTGEVIPIDPRLLSVVYLVNTKLSNKHPISVISGYRSEETNRKLAEINSGVARNSYHIKGQAIDLRIEGIDSKLIRNAATKLRVGGVGYYEKSNFVHLDTGPRRTW